MQLTKIIADLREEREKLEEAIGSLERLAYHQGNRRGRPPGSISRPRTQENETGEPPKKRILSPEARRRIAAAQKRRWAEARQSAAS